MRPCHQHKAGVTASSIPIANSIGKDGGATWSIVTKRASPPNTIMDVNSRTLAVCCSIRGIIHQKLSPSPHNNPER